MLTFKNNNPVEIGIIEQQPSFNIKGFQYHTNQKDWSQNLMTCHLKIELIFSNTKKNELGKIYDTLSMEKIILPQHIQPYFNNLNLNKSFGKFIPMNKNDKISECKILISIVNFIFFENDTIDLDLQII